MAIPSSALRAAGIVLVVVGAVALTVSDLAFAHPYEGRLLIAATTLIAAACGCAVALHRRARRSA